MWRHFLVFHRHHEKDVTRLRELDYGPAAHTCRSIVDFEANGLYLWALSQDMPTGTYTRRCADNNFCPGNVYFFGKMAMEWLEWCQNRSARLIPTRAVTVSVMRSNSELRSQMQ